MYRQEDTARNEKKGIWKITDHQILNGEEAAQNKHGYEIVKDIIKSVAAVKNTIYLNFGQNWRNDFTVAIPVDMRRDLLSAGHDPLKWQDKTIRVRGWIEEYNGPYIKIDHIERLEFSPKDSENTNSIGKDENASHPLPGGQEGNKLNLIPFNDKSGNTSKKEY